MQTFSSLWAWPRHSQWPGFASIIDPIKFDEDLISNSIGDEDFIDEVGAWKETAETAKRRQTKAKAKQLSSSLSSTRKQNKKGRQRKVDF